MRSALAFIPRTPSRATYYGPLYHANNFPSIVGLENVSVYYDGKCAIRDVTVNFPHGQITAIIGSSGCGKSTLLRTINRMNELNDNCRLDGRVLHYGKDIYRRGVDLIAVRKTAGMVFQAPNPFPMSIYDNVAYPLRIDGIKDKIYIDERVETALKQSSLWEEVKDNLKDSALTLSGGQQQRLCIARAIVSEYCPILLMDEPCSQLDPFATAQIEDLTDTLRKDRTVIIITHNMFQAARFANWVAFMNKTISEDEEPGYLHSFTPTEETFINPPTKELSDFIIIRPGRVKAK